MYGRAVLFLLSLLCVGCQLRESMSDLIKSRSASTSSSSSLEGAGPWSVDGQMTLASPAAKEVGVPVIHEAVEI